MYRAVSVILSFLLLSFSAIAAADSFAWGTVTMGGGGFVSAIITSKTEKNGIYARTDVGGAYRWNEADKSWVPLTDFLTEGYNGIYGIEAIALDPQHSERVYMFAGTGYFNDGLSMILRSNNYGDTWDTINVTKKFKANGNGEGRQGGERLAVDPNNSDILFCGTRLNGLWKSKDRGSTWINVTGLTAPTGLNQGIGFIVFDKNKVASGVTQRIYAGKMVLGDTTNTNLFVSDDGGETWSAIKLPKLSRSVMPYRAVLSPGGKYLYVTTANNLGPGWATGGGVSRGAFLRYDTEAKTWVNLSPENMMDDPVDPANPHQTLSDAILGGFCGVSMDPNDSNHIVITSHNKWKPQRWATSTKVAWGDKIWVTSNGGTSWYSVFGDYDDKTVNTASDTDPYAVLNKNGYNWIEGESIHWAMAEFDPFNTKRVFVTSGNGIFMADDFGANKRFEFHFTVKGVEETVPYDLVSIPGGSLITAIADYDGFVHTDITKPVSGSRHSPQMGMTTGLAYAKLNSNIVVRVGGSSETGDKYVFPLYYSTDTAKTWTKFATDPNPSQDYRGKIAISSDGTVVLWKPEGRNYFYRTDNWGVTWTKNTNLNTDKLFLRADPIDNNVFFAFSQGIYKSVDKGISFTKVIGNRHIDWTKDMQVAPGRSGHIWVTGFAADGINGGFLTRSTNGGKTWFDVDPASDPQYTQRIKSSSAIGFGKEAPGASYPAIYIYGKIGDVTGIWQSIDEAKSWTKIDDAQHQYGDLSNGCFVRGDANTFGVVYRSTAGRGIAARMPESWSRTGVRKLEHTTIAKYAYNFSVTSGNLKITVPNKSDALNVGVYNLAGRLMYSKTVINTVVLPINTMLKTQGIYMLCVQSKSDGVLFSKKMHIVR